MLLRDEEEPLYSGAEAGESGACKLGERTSFSKVIGSQPQKSGNGNVTC